MDFPALSSPESQLLSQKYVGDDLQPPTFLIESPEDSLLRFALAVKKVPALKSSIWKYERNGSANATIGTSRISQMLAVAYLGGIGRGSYDDRVPNRASARAAPVWLETGDAVGNVLLLEKFFGFDKLFRGQMPSAHKFRSTLLRRSKSVLRNCGKKHVTMLA